MAIIQKQLIKTEKFQDTKLTLYIKNDFLHSYFATVSCNIKPFLTKGIWLRLRVF